MPRHHLSETDVARALGMLEAGLSQRRVARMMGVSQSVISRANQRHPETGPYSERPRSGRPVSTTPRDDRYLTNLSLRNRFHSARRLNNDFAAATGVIVSTQTIRNRLHRANMHARRPAQCVPLTPAHRRIRLNWAREHVRWTRQQWRRVLFTDESRFSLDHNDGRSRVWRRPGERFADPCIAEHDRYGGGSVMVWGGITYANRTRLYVVPGGAMTGVRYRDEVLEPIVVPFAENVGQNIIFMDDNARAHRARVVTEFLEGQGIERMEWPARSPDLNPIEHVWDMMGRSLEQLEAHPLGLQQLGVALEAAWDALDVRDINRLISSMRQRCEAVIAAGGGHTRY